MERVRGRSIITALALITAFVFTFLLACDGKEHNKDRRVRVTVVDSELFEIADGGASTQLIDRYDTAEFILVTDDRHYIADADCESFDITPLGNDRTRLSIKRVASNVRVRVTCLADDRATVVYDANGGGYRNFTEPYTMRYALDRHIRPNTETGVDSVYRDGYTLIGWNTAADGSGTHIGLGSRCDATKDSPLTLYAEWVRHSPLSDFFTDGAGDSRRIVKYNGDAKTVCIPDKTADGAAITTVMSGAFAGSSVETVILSDRITHIAPHAFDGCAALKELYMFDSIKEISDDSFDGCVELTTVHINAAIEPRYSALDRHSNYADKYDLLIKNKDRRKLVIWGGSGAYFSVDSSMIRDALDGEYEVINVAINGWFSTYVQADAIIKYLRDGDVLLHIPEMCSTPQLFFNTAFAMQNAQSPGGYDDRLFTALEGNYDLLALADLRRIDGVFDSFNRYNAERDGKPAVKYSDGADFIDAFGDYRKPKPEYGKDISISNEAELRLSALTDVSNAARNAFYGEAKANGATVLTAFAAVNRHALEARDKQYGTDYTADAVEFERKFTLGIDNAVCIESIADSFYDGGLFFNSDWHLGERATGSNTEVIIDGIKTALGASRLA